MPELKNLIEKSNSQLEEVLPLLTQNASAATMYMGLRQLEKSTDQIIIELATFLEKYPHIAKEKIAIVFHLKKPLDRLGKNLRETVAAGIAWEKRIGHEKEFKKLADSIMKKKDKVNSLLRAAVEPEYE